METYLLLILAVLIVLGLWVVMIYNGLIRLKVRTNEAWSDIDVQLKRRYDLIPNLINTVKGYATHERELFEKVTKARANAMNAQNPEAKAEAENMLSGALKSLFAVSENYPDLKANENFLELQRELSDTENKIQASRRFYNGNVRDLNTKIQVFPDSIVANTLKIGKREFFEIEDVKEKETPKVEF
ncbi:LemA family protein [Candidatus Parcubacteria bacterium]|nr:LemA family protein [Candidatus Parcubacteria bacterium]